MRLIDADKLFNNMIIVVEKANEDVFRVTSELLGKIKNAPTIDAVPVVRCKDCKYIGSPLSPTDDYHTCKHQRAMIDAPVDGFCCWGERRTDEAE